jgi:hypothetical protein
MPQTVGFRSSALLQPNQDTKEKMKKKPDRKSKSAPRAPRKPTCSLERVLAASVMTLKDADPDLFSKTLGALKCSLAVELLKITDMEFGIERSFQTGDPLLGRSRRKFCFHYFCY